MKRQCRLGALVALSILGCLLAGCTVNRAYVAGNRLPGDGIVQQVACVSTVRAAGEPCQVVGMIHTQVLPIGRNTEARRQALAQSTAAKLGISTIGALHTCEGLMGDEWAISSGLLLHPGTDGSSDVHTAPKCIVSLLPIKYGIQTNELTGKLDNFLRSELQWALPTAGYFAFRRDLDGVDSQALASGRVDARALGEPIGVEPDFALLVEVAGYDKTGTPVLIEWKTLTVNVVLFDLKEKRPAWSSISKGGMAQGVFLLPFGPLINIIGMAVTSKESDLKDSTMSTVRGIMKEIPVVDGYRRVKM